MLKGILKDHWNKLELIEKDFLISISEDMWSAIAPYQQIIKMGIKTLKHS